MEWVLIIFLSGWYSESGFCHDFNDHETCLAALEMAGKHRGFRYGFCTPKGERK